MDAEARLRSKHLYKIELWTIKYIPFALALVCFVNTTLSYFDIDLTVFSYIGGISILPLVFLYLSSFVFRFCIFHRLPLHYVAVNMGINMLDDYVGIPLSDRTLMCMYMMITAIFIFVTAYEHHKERMCKSAKGTG